MKEFILRILYDYIVDKADLELNVETTWRELFAAKDDLRSKKFYFILNGLFGKVDSLLDFDVINDLMDLLWLKKVFTWWVDLSFVWQGCLFEPLSQFNERILILVKRCFFAWPRCSDLFPGWDVFRIHYRRWRIWITEAERELNKRLLRSNQSPHKDC